MNWGFIFSDVVQSGEVDLQHVVQLVPLRRDENEPALKPPCILEPLRSSANGWNLEPEVGTGFLPSQQRSQPGSGT
jgi:hypothetical protein